MSLQNTSEVSRRSSRVPMAVPVLVTSLDPGTDFSEVCETVVVSAHGCAIRSPMRVKAGVPVHFHSKEGRQTMARIVDCQPLGSNPQGWKLGAQLDEPDNFWGLNPCPEDWLASNGNHVVNTPVATSVPSNHRHTNAGSGVSQQSLSDDSMRSMIRQLLQPLQADLADLRSKLAQREANPSRFEVSLSQIPPQLEEKLWSRLRQEVGQRSLQLAREESERVLGAAHASIERHIGKTQDELRQHIANQLTGAEQRTQALADGIAESVQQHLHTGLDQFQHQVLDAESQLKGQTEELLQAVQQQLHTETRAHRLEMDKVREAVAEDSSRLRGEVADISARLEKLDELARRLESDFEARLTAAASDIVQQTRLQLEGAVHVLLKQLSTRSSEALAKQLEEGCARLGHVQKEIEISLSESLQSRVAQSVAIFEQTMERSAQDSVASWRRTLARDLSAVLETLGQQLQTDAAGDDGMNHRSRGK